MTPLQHHTNDPNTGGWLLFRSVRSLWNQHKATYGALSRDVRRRFWIRLGGGFLLAMLFCAGITLLGRHFAGAGMAQWDSDRLAWIIEEQPLFTFYNATIIESFGNLALTVPIVILTAVVMTRRNQPLPVIGCILGYAGLRPLVYFGWWIWNRARPEMVADGIASPPLHSYPSGHALISLFVYGFLAWLWWRSTRSSTERITCVVLTAVLLFFIGWARLRLGTHWPSDIIAGFLIGGVWLGAVIWSINSAGTDAWPHSDH